MMTINICFVIFIVVSFSIKYPAQSYVQTHNKTSNRLRTTDFSRFILEIYPRYNKVYRYKGGFTRHAETYLINIHSNNQSKQVHLFDFGIVGKPTSTASFRLWRTEKSLHSCLQFSCTLFTRERLSNVCSLCTCRPEQRLEVFDVKRYTTYNYL